jgi:hypothetical protein
MSSFLEKYFIFSLFFWELFSLKGRFKSEVHHLKSLTEESSSVKVGCLPQQTDKLTKLITS